LSRDDFEDLYNKLCATPGSEHKAAGPAVAAPVQAVVNALNGLLDSAAAAEPQPALPLPQPQIAQPPTPPPSASLPPALPLSLPQYPPAERKPADHVPLEFSAPAPPAPKAPPEQQAAAMTPVRALLYDVLASPGDPAPTAPLEPAALDEAFAASQGSTVPAQSTQPEPEPSAPFSSTMLHASTHSTPARNEVFAAGALNTSGHPSDASASTSASRTTADEQHASQASQHDGAALPTSAEAVAPAPKKMRIEIEVDEHDGPDVLEAVHASMAGLGRQVPHRINSSYRSLSAMMPPLVLSPATSPSPDGDLGAQTTQRSLCEVSDTHCRFRSLSLGLE